MEKVANDIIHQGFEGVYSVSDREAISNSSFQWKERSIVENATETLVNSTVWGNSLERKITGPGLQISTVVALFLMIFGFVSNMAVVVVTTCRIRREKKMSSIQHFLRHLAAADILVTALFLPQQAGWIRSISWELGDAVCKIFAFTCSFGRYLSGYVIVAISIERYLAVYKLSHGDETVKRAKLMLLLAWAASLLLSIPEAVHHHVYTYPHMKMLQQCAPIGTFSSAESEFAYAAVQQFLLCGFPFAVVTFCYSGILWKMWRSHGECGHGSIALARAKKRAATVSVIVVLAFLVCWVPYNVIWLWLWIEPESALMLVNPQVVQVLSLFACINVCVNPIAYGCASLQRN